MRSKGDVLVLFKQGDNAGIYRRDAFSPSSRIGCMLKGENRLAYYAVKAVLSLSYMDD